MFEKAKAAALKALRLLLKIPGAKFLLKTAVASAVKEKGDEWQKELREAVEREGPKAVDKAVDSLQAFLLRAIDSL